MIEWFSVNTVFFSLWGYPMSYLEFVGTLLYLSSVILIYRKNMWTWPTGIASVILFAMLFYQIQLYSDALEQFYYLAASIYGWLFWRRTQTASEQKASFRYSSLKATGLWLAICVLVSFGLFVLMKNIHLLLPELFAKPAAYPFTDALTTIMSFTAMFLMARKRIESWLYWITVDVIGIYIYFMQGIKFISLLYMVLLLIACLGYLKWHRERSRTHD